MKRKFMGIVLALCMMCAFVPWVEAASNVDSGTCGDNLTWTLNSEGTLTISGEGDMINRGVRYAQWSNIKSVVIENGVTSIGARAFYECRDLTSITIPNSVMSIGDSAFYMCSSITSITIPDSVTSIGKGAFWHCHNLTNIIMPQYVDSIGDRTFFYCGSIIDIEIPNSVKNIGEFAFGYCTHLSNVTIPDSVISIGEGAFASCSSLVDINVDDKNEYYIFEDGALFNKDKTAIISYLAGQSNTKYTIPDSVTNITCAFYGCKNLMNVIMPNNLTSIGSCAFRGCTNLTNVSIPENVTQIGYCAFEYCERMTAIIIPDKVSAIEDYTFSGCSRLTDIIIPDSVKSIASHAFYRTAYRNNDDNWDNGLLYIGHHLISADAYITECEIKNTTLTIADSAFYNCDNITSIIIPDSVISIGDDAFGECYDLTSITIPNSIESIGAGAFGGCIGLTSITIPNNITRIGDETFYSCESLTSIRIPNSVKSIGSEAFLGCTALTDVYYGGTEEQWNKINISTEDNEDLLNANIHFNSVPTTKPEIVGIPMVEQVSDNIYNITVSLENVEYESQMIATLNDDNAIVGLNSTQLSAGDISKTLTVNAESATTAKIFIWDSLEGMRPLCEAKTVTIK